MIAALLLTALLAAPLQPVSYSWVIAPAPDPPAVPPPGWVPFRLDELRVSLRATEATVAQVGAYYRIAERPEFGWVSWHIPILVSFAAGQTRQITFEVPWSGYAPGPALVSAWQDCGDGRVHYQGGFVPRPGETLPRELAGMPFSAFASGSFCPEIAAIFADGFEVGDLSRWEVTP